MSADTAAAPASLPAESSTTNSTTTTTTTAHEQDVIQRTEDGRHLLKAEWTLWFMHRAPGQKITDYEGAIKKIGSFGTIEDYWAVYSHLKRANDLPNISDYHMFRKGVRPVWEDEANVQGGKWICRLKKGLASRYWEQLIMAVISEQFNVGDEICGLVVSVRHSEDILSIWNRTSTDTETNLKIRDTIKRVLGLPLETVMEYKSHNDAIQDNSSFRNTAVYK
ncbi:translation initiation factor eIF 4e-like domain-containing protein [Syncephalis plumigaleata]|nr:translation initiation factor eIF 4e-like domain-containing protein [Syncephalis plumigaleata]